MDGRLIDTVLLVVFAAASMWFFGRFVVQIRRSLANMQIAVSIAPVEEDPDMAYISLDEQQDIENFVALLEREGFKKLDFVAITNTWYTTTLVDKTPLYVSPERTIVAILERARSFLPASIVFISGFADGVSLTTGSPFGNKSDHKTRHSQFAYDTTNALNAHRQRLPELEKVHGHVLPVNHISDYEAQRQAALRHYSVDWNASLITLMEKNQRLYGGVVVVLLVVAIGLLLTSLQTKSVIMAGTVVVAFFVAASITTRWNNQNLRLGDALDAGKTPTPDIRYPPVFEFTRPKRQKGKAS
jgi:hypothetical protein